MSVSSIEEEEELINFDNLEILHLNSSGSVIKEAICEININNNQKKKITIKMNNPNYSESSQSEIISTEKDKNDKIKKKLNNEKDPKNIKLKEVSEVKYNLFLGFTKDCKPAYDKYDALVGSELSGHRLIIQDIEITENELNYKPKKFVFIPLKKDRIFPLENNGEISFSIEGKKIMKLNGKPLVSSADFIKKGSIYEKFQKMNDTNSKNNETFSNKTENNNSINLNKPENKSTSKKEESLSKFKSNPSSIYGASSKINNSSETEADIGNVFYDEIEKDKKYTRYSYYEKYVKEVDGIFNEHEEIKLNKKIVEIKFDKGKNFDNLNNVYDIDNDLKAHILIKNFEEESIPKDVPFFLEVKSSFKLVDVLKQIRKASKFIDNIKKYEYPILPRYIIGILCSYDEDAVKSNFNILSGKYMGYDSNDVSNDVTLYQHIKRIIDRNNIKFLIATIQNGSINEYNIINNDYGFYPFNRVSLDLMMEQFFTNDKFKELKEMKQLGEIKNKINDRFKILNASINRESQFKELRIKLMEMTNKISEKDKEIIEKNNKINEKEKEIIEKDNKISEKDKEIIEKDNKISEKEKEIIEKDNKINEKDKKIKQLNEEKKRMEEEAKNIMEQMERMRKELEMYRKEKSQSKEVKDNGLESRKAP